MTDEKLLPCPFDQALWKGGPCPNHSKGWINDSRGNRLTRLGNRNALGKLIEAHNREIESLKSRIKNTRIPPAQPTDADRAALELFRKSAAVLFHHGYVELADNALKVADLVQRVTQSTPIPEGLAEVRRLRALMQWNPLEEWHEDDGPAFWTKFPVCEPYYSGSPLDTDWPGYHTHFIPMSVFDHLLDREGKALGGGE